MQRTASTASERIVLAQTLDQPPLGTMRSEAAAAIMQAADYPLLYQISCTTTNALKYDRQFKHLGVGSTRDVYTWKDSNSVVKIPRNRLGVRMNQAEVAYYEQAAFFGHPVIPCRLDWLDNGLPVVIMEKVRTATKRRQRIPSWGENIDGGQIAQSPMLDGLWAAYDAAYPPCRSSVQVQFGYHGGFEHEYARLIDSQIIGKDAPASNEIMACLA